MNVFINAISNNGYLALFDTKRNIIAEKHIAIRWNESSQFIELLDSFIKENSLSYTDIENIVCVNGPGSFTGVRTIVLVVNSLGFLHNIKLTDISYFDLFENFPIIKSSSRRDSFVKKDNNSDIEIIQNTDLEIDFEENNIDEIYGESNYIFENVSIVEKINYSAIIQDVEFQNKKKIEALYIKKPNIS